MKWTRWSQADRLPARWVGGTLTLGCHILVGLTLVVGLIAGHDIQQLIGIEAGERQIEVIELEFFEFEPQQILVPVRPGGRSVGEDTQGLDLFWCQIIG